MDKKSAEEEVLRKAKDAQAAAGKNVGMSGRDLVSGSDYFMSTPLIILHHASSNTTPNGLRTRRRKSQTGISVPTGKKNKMRTSERKKREYDNSMKALSLRKNRRTVLKQKKRANRRKPDCRMGSTVYFVNNWTYCICAMMTEECGWSWLSRYDRLPEPRRQKTNSIFAVSYSFDLV